MPKPLFLLLAGTLTATLVLPVTRAQTTDNGETGNAQPQSFQFERVRLPGGPAGNNITSIVQDPQGFMWFGTWGGLHKYDGYEVTTYHSDPYDSESLSSNRIERLYVDRSGTLWVATFGGGLNRFASETETFSHFRHDPDDPTSLSSDTVSVVLEDRFGTLWVGTAFDGLNHFASETETFSRFRHDPDDPTSLSNDQVRTLYEDRSGALWIGTGEPFYEAIAGGLNRFDPATETFSRFMHDSEDEHSLIDNRVQVLFEDAGGTFWVGTWDDGLHAMDRETGAFTRHRFDPNDPGKLSRPHLEENPGLGGVSFVHEDRSGVLWIGAYEGGLNRFDPATETLMHYEAGPEDPHTLSSNDVWTIYESREGALWIGTWQGLYKLVPAPSKFPHYTLDLGEGSNDVRAIYEDASGNLWIGTSASLIHFDRTSGAVAPYVPDPDILGALSNWWVWAVYEDTSGLLWIGTWGRGLNTFDPATETFTHYLHDPDDPGSLSFHQIRVIYEDRSGLLWVGTARGLNTFDPATETFTHYLHDPDDPRSLSSNYVNGIYQDQKGMLWVGTPRGLNTFDPATETFTRYLHDPDDPRSLSSNAVIGICEDQKGRLWIATGHGGLNRFDRDTNSFTHFTESNSALPDNSIISMIGDEQGSLWISTRNSLTRFNPDANTFHTFGEDHGLRAGTFNYHAVFKSQQGELFFGGTNGFHAFLPEHFQIAANPRAPQVVLTGFRLFHQPVRPGRDSPLDVAVSEAEAITLKHDQNVFSFDFAGLHYSNPVQNQYAFMLENYDEVWREAGMQRTATYVKVPPGRYVFRVKAANSNGVWSEGTSIRVTIHAPWWRTWWAYALYGLVVIGAFLGAYRVQHSRIVRKEREQWLLKEKDLRANAAEAWANYLQAENLRQTQELEAARRLQLSMLPETIPEHPTVELTASMQTASEVGGDYYDFDLSEDGTLTIAIGDATGHGTKAGTMVTATKSLFANMADEADLVQVIQKSSRALKRMHLPKLYMALALARLRDYTLELVGAGMPPALVYRAATGAVETVPLKGMPLGGPGRAQYRKRCVVLSPGDTVVLMTDGFPERFSDKGEMLGYDRAVEVFAEVADRSSEEIIGHLMKRCETWAHGREQNDDVTFVVMKMKASAERQGGQDGLTK